MGARKLIDWKVIENRKYRPLYLAVLKNTSDLIQAEQAVRWIAEQEGVLVVNEDESQASVMMDHGGPVIDRKKLADEAIELLTTLPLGQGMNGTGVLRLHEILNELGLRPHMPVCDLVVVLREIHSGK